jgi:hypothetical protein
LSLDAEEEAFKYFFITPMTFVTSVDFTETLQEDDGRSTSAFYFSREGVIRRTPRKAGLTSTVIPSHRRRRASRDA